MACENNMGFVQPEWNNGDAVLKTRFRWFFGIQNITGGISEALPCIKASRPKIQFREMQAEHLNETIFYPSKPDWQPIQITLYDKCLSSEHPVFTWLKQQYNPQPTGHSFVSCNFTPTTPPDSESSEDSQVGSWNASCDVCKDCVQWKPCIDPLAFKTCVCLQLYDGCGNVIEAWIIEHAYPQTVDFGELDMGTSEVLTADITLRYDRAFQIFPEAPHTLYDTTTCVSCIPDECASSNVIQSSNNNSSSSSNSESMNLMQQFKSQLLAMNSRKTRSFTKINTTPDFVML